MLVLINPFTPKAAHWPVKSSGIRQGKSFEFHSGIAKVEHFHILIEGVSKTYQKFNMETMQIEYILELSYQKDGLLIIIATLFI